MTSNNEVRIIGGKWRGRKLVFPKHQDLRPTLGRVRETLFNWLRADITDSRCLDLFAGSGALGFEAASRGAAAVTLVDNDRTVCRTLRDHVQRLDADLQVRVVCAPATVFLHREAGPWDLIFLDPPFRQGVLGETLDAIAASGALAAEGLIYVEVGRRDPMPGAGWRQIRHGRAGDTQFGLLATP